MGTLLELPREIATAFFFAAAIGVATGAIVSGHTQHLAPALPVALAAFGVAVASFAYAIWRSRRLVLPARQGRMLDDHPSIDARR